MKNKFILLTFLFLYNFSIAQTINSPTYTATTGAIPDGGTTPKCFPITVSGIGNINGTTFGLASVCINITHAYVGDLEIYLKAPDGTTVALSLQNGGAGNNYTNTCFNASATVTIASGTAPYSGSFLPDGWLGSVNNGQTANGVFAFKTSQVQMQED